MINSGSKPKNPLYDFAYLGKDISVLLMQLKEMAIPEQWEYTNSPNLKPMPILFNYLIHTFIRVKEEDKIGFMDNYICFNTGLITPNQEEIFMLFKKRPETDALFFVTFCKESSREIIRFNPLPKRAQYFNDVSDLFYDTRIELRINIDHIIEDEENRNRFPVTMQSYSKHQLVNTFKGAIDHAIKRINRNYKTAVPQFYKGQLQLLIPLCLQDATRADLALALFKTENSYSGRTCLTLDMAMNNARLITRPDDDWLRP